MNYERCITGPQTYINCTALQVHQENQSLKAELVVHTEVRKPSTVGFCDNVDNSKFGRDYAVQNANACGLKQPNSIDFLC